MLDLSKYMTFPQEMLEKLREGTRSLSHDKFLEPAQTGLKRRSKALTEKDWGDLAYVLDTFEIFSPGSKDEEGSHDINYADACMARNWLGQDGVSISKILRMQMSYDPQFVVARRIRWALQIFEQVILRDGAIDGSTGHTILPYGALIELIASEQPLGFHASISLPDEEKGDIRYTIPEAQALIDEMVAENLLAYMEIEGDARACVYAPEYLALETDLVKLLTEPVTPSIPYTQSPYASMEHMDEAQKTAFLAILSRKTRGFGLGGYPGAGKTYLCGLFAELVGARNVLALATTGAAAQVLAKALPAGVACFTISSAYCNRGNASWKTALNRPIVIVDECSMLNAQFQNQLKDFVEEFAPECVIITGDPKQLAPIGAGSFFENLMIGGYPQIPVSVLTEQHRMEPAALSLLSHFEHTISWRDALSKDGETNYGMTNLPTVVFAQSPTTHNLMAINAPNALIMCLMPVGGFSKLTDPIIAGSHLTRWLLSAHKSEHCKLLSNCLEAARSGYDTKPLIDAITRFRDLATKQNLEASGRIPVKGNRVTTQTDKYVGSYCLDRIVKEATTKYRDELEELEAKIGDLYADLRSHVVDTALAPGSFVRCNKNLNFAFWGKKRCEAERKKYGIACSSNLANGLTFFVLPDGSLINTESGTVIAVTDRKKASKLLRLSWCSTTHKLQGDQGARSYYFHSSPKAENKLVYVALSRGREKNVCLVNTSDAMYSWKGPQMSRSVRRLSALAVRNEGKI